MTKTHYKAILADLDGTVNRGDVLISGVEAIYRDLSESGVQWLFLSNNARLSASDLALKLRKLGIPVSEQQVINSASALIHTLQREHTGQRFMVVGEAGLIRAIEEAGATVSEYSANVDIVVVALDKSFTYKSSRGPTWPFRMVRSCGLQTLTPRFRFPAVFIPGQGAL